MAFDFKSGPLRPRRSDRLFQRSLQHDPAIARLRSDPDAYTHGYRRAAEYLVKCALTNQRDCNALAYPIVFLYRHHIELALKRIIWCVPGILSRELTDQERKHLNSHQLKPLWDDLEPIFGSICKAVNWKKPKAADLYGAREYIRQLSEVDPSSESFRFWKLKSGASSLPANLDSFNIRHFSEMMNRFADFIEELDTATIAASEMLDDLNSVPF